MLQCCDITRYYILTVCLLYGQGALQSKLEILQLDKEDFSTVMEAEQSKHQQRQTELEEQLQCAYAQLRDLTPTSEEELQDEPTRDLADFIRGVKAGSVDKNSDSTEDMVPGGQEMQMERTVGALSPEQAPNLMLSQLEHRVAELEKQLNR